MMKTFSAFLAALFALGCVAAHAAAGEIGAVVLHGKWGSSGGPIAPLVSTLQREGVIVSAPDMPWSARSRALRAGNTGARQREEVSRVICARARVCS